MKITRDGKIQLELTAEQARRMAEVLDNGQVALKLSPSDMRHLRDRNFQEWQELHDTIRDAKALAGALYSATSAITAPPVLNDWAVIIDLRDQ